MIKYFVSKVFFGKAEIIPVEVSRETSVAVWIDGKRNGKDTSAGKFFDTWQKAHDWLTHQATERVTTARRMLELANGFRGNVKGLTPDMCKPVVNVHCKCGWVGTSDRILDGNMCPGCGMDVVRTSA